MITSIVLIAFHSLKFVGLDVINKFTLINKFNINKANNDLSTSALTSQRQISSSWFIQVHGLLKYTISYNTENLLFI